MCITKCATVYLVLLLERISAAKYQFVCCLSLRGSQMGAIYVQLKSILYFLSGIKIDQLEMNLNNS